MPESVITAALDSIDDKTNDASRVFYSSEKAKVYYENCAAHVANAGELKFLASFNGEIPITTYSYSRDSSTYVTTTESHYVDYGWDEVVFHTKNPLIRLICRVVLVFIRFLCWFSEVNHRDVCFFNNYLVSTNLYRDEKTVAEQYETAFDELSRLHGKNICLFRCLDRIGTPNLLKTISEDTNAVLVASRVVNQLDTLDDSIWQRSNCKKDSIVLERHLGASRKVLRAVQTGDISIGQVLEQCAKESTQSSHIMRKLRDDESMDVYNRLRQVYASLYLEKYSMHNPQYTANFFREATKVWTIIVLERRQDHMIEGFACLSDLGGDIVSCPALGYDMSSDTPSYIMLQFWTILEARSRRKRLNMSGGVTAYKQMRGAVPVLEYSGVKFSDRTGFRRRLFWRILGFLTRKLVRPILARKSIT